VVEALLLAEGFGEEMLKDRQALQSLESRLATYVGLAAPEQAPLSCALEEDPEHNCFKLVVTTRANGTGYQTVIDREFLTSAEFREIKKTVRRTIRHRRPALRHRRRRRQGATEILGAILSYVMEGGKRGQYIQRYKGLGEMNPEQLWETTMNPETRVLLQVRVEDAVEADLIFSTLMGDEVEPRRKFIEDNALSVRNLDI